MPFVVGRSYAHWSSASRGGTSRCSARRRLRASERLAGTPDGAAAEADSGNGLPDALDLMIVCIEAGSGIDQAIMKTSDELDITHPALAEEMRLVTTEMRAGKPRLEAFKNFASRTKVDEVRSLVSMLVQTDRFGTSVAQALRTHAEMSRARNGVRTPRREPPKSASSSCSRWSSVCSRPCTSRFLGRPSWTTSSSSNQESWIER